MINNKISGGFGEGIYIVKGGNSWIIRNVIEHNLIGIVSIQS